MNLDPIRAAVEEVHLGASIADLHDGFLMRVLAIDREDDLTSVLRDLPLEQRRAVREHARRFTGDVCRRLGDLHGRDTRVCRVLEEWVQTSKDYDAFDALLSNFDFPARERLVEEGKRLFPSTLTAHW